MDSLTQAVLGAAIGQAVLTDQQRPIVYAGVLGAVAATLPDLDSLFLLHLTDVERTFFHRGVSHSLLMGGVAAFVFAGMFHFFVRALSYWRWVLFWGMVFVTHALLDCFTTWGTQLLWPLPDRISFNSVFIIDPLYTIPLLIGVIMARWHRHCRPAYIGLFVSTLYLGLSLGVKTMVNDRFETFFVQNGLHVTRYMTRPAPFGIVLWGMVAETEEHFIEADYRLFQSSPIEYVLVPKFNAISGLPRVAQAEGAMLRDISKGYFVIDWLESDVPVVFDLRYGRMGGQYVFQYVFDPDTQAFHHQRPAYSSSMWRELGAQIARD